MQHSPNTIRVLQPSQPIPNFQFPQKPTTLDTFPEYFHINTCASDLHLLQVFSLYHSWFSFVNSPNLLVSQFSSTWEPFSSNHPPTRIKFSLWSAVRFDWASPMTWSALRKRIGCSFIYFSAHFPFAFSKCFSPPFMNAILTRFIPQILDVHILISTFIYSFKMYSNVAIR